MWPALLTADLATSAHIRAYTQPALLGNGARNVSYRSSAREPFLSVDKFIIIHIWASQIYSSLLCLPPNCYIGCHCTAPPLQQHWQFVCTQPFTSRRLLQDRLFICFFYRLFTHFTRNSFSDLACRQPAGRWMEPGC